MLVKVNDFQFPTDFVILYMKGDSKTPLIFGRPFLGISRDLINVKSGEFILRIQEKKVNLKVFEVMHSHNGNSH